MRDNHRPKQDLIHEITSLRKQIVDLKEAMVARRRVEDAVREAESRLRSLTDGAPVGLCLFRSDGVPLAANVPFARLLGYESPAELQRIAGVLGVFANSDEQTRVLGSAGTRHGSGAFFRHKDGTHFCLSVLAARCPEGNTVAIAVHQRTRPE
jgi:PAS domain S-box-containing protein